MSGRRISDSAGRPEKPDAVLATTYAMYANLPNTQLRKLRWVLEVLGSVLGGRISFDQEWPGLNDEAAAHGIDLHDVAEPMRTALHRATVAAVEE
jgi:hypothetical protein